MKVFEVYAKTSLPVYSDGMVIMDGDCANDNIVEYLVDELDEDGCVVKTLLYDVEDFSDIAKDHPAPEWQCHDWQNVI